MTFMRVNVKPATKGFYHHTYDVSTIMSLDLGQLIPSRVFEVVESDEFNRFHGKAIVRLAPQDFPAYGKLYYKTAAFFVPDHQIMAYASALRSDMNMYKGKPVATPHIHHWVVARMFYDHSGTSATSLCTKVISPSSSDLYDFTFPEPGQPSSLAYYKFTTLGRIFYKMLKSVGIDMPSFVNLTGSHPYSDFIATASTPVNIISLLSFAKVYCDYFMNSHFYNSNQLVALLHAIHDCESYSVSGTTYFDNSTFELSPAGLYFLLDSILVPFEQNMYTTAWNSPNSPTGVAPETEMGVVNGDGVMSPYRSVMHTTQGDILQKVISDDDSTSLSLANVVADTPYFSRNLSDLGLRYLRAISDFIRRNNLFGSRAVERLFARFGIKNDDYKSHYCHKLYEGQDRIDFSAVMSNSDTTGKTLGAYAGFGVGSLDIDFNYKSDSNGFIVVLCWLQETPIWIRGTMPYCLRNHSLDWYNPEFDGESIRAIPLMEFSSNKSGDASSLVNGDKTIYGFTDLYDEYRYERDTVLGDFVLDENSTRHYFFGRDLSKSRERAIALKPQTNTVQYYNHLPNDQLTNPFQISASVADRFYIQIDWDIEVQRIIRSKSDALMLNGEGNIDIPVGGHLID